jgi:hypothetical protein
VESQKEIRPSSQDRASAHRGSNFRASGKFAETHSTARLRGDMDHTIREHQLLRRSAEFFSRKVQQCVSRLGRCRAQHRAEHARGERTKGPHIESASIRVAQYPFCTSLRMSM